MSVYGQAITNLSESESWKLLASVELGRPITSVEGQPEGFPVNFATRDQTILFRTAEGTKLTSIVLNHDVVFEADHHNRRLECHRQGSRACAGYPGGDRRS